MNDIKQIAPDAAIGKVGRKQTNASKPSEEIRKEKSAEVSDRKDSLQVDQMRKEEAHLIDNSRLLLEELPEVRNDKVALARQRLQEGFYDKPEVLNETTSKLLKEQSEITDMNVQQVKSRLAKGYYDSPDILNQTAGNILKDID